ncbi:nucleotide cyclase [Penicillium angulare]|uniref:nucleotide cyclase n=1 Tax=Penicillium angulare TaxID=116970 RepID=UPI0025425C21|nr:nucleotide cyclase [Penicillium angulare]KAJ5272298.1 nucleotide cyclase [Penicillium angulare]
MNDLFKLAINSATIFAETDKKGTITNVNDLFCAASGYSRHELIGQSYHLIKSGHHPTSFYHEMWTKVTGGSIWRGQICHKTKIGTLYWINCTIIPINAPGTTAFISVSFDITSKETIIENLQWKVCHDSLTGLYNRTFLLEHIQKKISASNSTEQNHFAIGMIDMNSFKNINDTYGHSTGDSLLVETAKRLKAVCREEDTVARMGGDEFLIVWNDAVGIESTIQGIERQKQEESVFRGILGRIFARPFLLEHGILLKIRGSLGVARYPDHGLDPLVLLGHADQAMYKAKLKRGEFVCVFDSTLRLKEMK